MGERAGDKPPRYGSGAASHSRNTAVPRAESGLTEVGGVVLSQEVLAPVARERSPHRVDVVRVVLGVVVLDHERRTLDRVVVASALLNAAAPGERNPVQPGPLDLVPLLAGDLVADPADIVLDDP